MRKFIILNTLEDEPHAMDIDRIVSFSQHKRSDTKQTVGTVVYKIHDQDTTCVYVKESVAQIADLIRAAYESD